MSQALLIDVPPMDGNDDGDERYTLPETLGWAKRAANVSAFDLDVAGCHEAHCALSYYTAKTDGLKCKWWGRVWCNPPYSNIEPWARRAWEQMERPDVTSVAMLLPANRTEQPWWHELVEPKRDIHNAFAIHEPTPWLSTHFLPGRTRFGHPGNPRGVGVGSPPFGCVLLVWRRS